MSISTATDQDFTALREDLASLKQDMVNLMSHLKSDVTASAQTTTGQLNDSARQILDQVTAGGTWSARAIEQKIEQQPLAALLIAAGIGYLSGRLLQTCTPDRKLRASLVPLGLFAIGCAFAAFICGMVAIWRYGDITFGRIGAPIIVAGVLCVFCAISMIFIRYAGRSRTRSSFPAPSPDQMLAEANTLIKANKTTALVAAAIAGFIAASSLK
eukprot:gene12274-12360_t